MLGLTDKYTFCGNRPRYYLLQILCNKIRALGPENLLKTIGPPPPNTTLTKILFGANAMDLDSMDINHFNGRFGLFQNIFSSVFLPFSLFFTFSHLSFCFHTLIA